MAEATHKGTMDFNIQSWNSSLSPNTEKVWIHRLRCSAPYGLNIIWGVNTKGRPIWLKTLLYYKTVKTTCHGNFNHYNKVLSALTLPNMGSIIAMKQPWK